MNRSPSPPRRSMMPLFAIAVVALGMLFIFNRQRQTLRSNAEPTTPTSVGKWVTKSGDGVQIRDGAGAIFQPMPNATIVSVAPNVTEILFALGVGDRVIGVTTNCNYPPEAAAKEKVGDFNLNYEKILSLKPSLVVGAKGFTDAARDVLAKANVPYFTVSHVNVEEIVESIYALGVVLGAEPAAAIIADDFQKTVVRAKDRAPADADKRATVFWLQWSEPVSTVGPGNFHHDLIELAGGKNIADDTGVPYGPFSEELLVLRAPQVVLTPSEEQTAWVKSRFPTLPAVKSGRVHVFNSDAIVRPGPRLVEALDELSALLYPSK